VLDNVSDGFLNIRTAAVTTARVVAAIPAGASDVSVGRCVPPEDGKGVPWCEVQWRGYAGWASSCCMVEAGEATRTFRVLADVSGGILNMRQGPGPNFDVVAAIPANAADVSVGRCRRPEGGGSTPWCEVKWRAYTGWASACCMVDVATGAYARAEN
jgi:SH3-like domain-containing protein